MTMDPVTQMVAEKACSDLCTKFFHLLDRRDYAGVASLMAPGGVWMRQGKALDGADAVVGALRVRPASLTTRHLLNNVVVTMTGPGSARVAYELSVYSQDGAGPAVHAAIMTGDDELEHDGASWRIRLKKAEKVLGFNR